MTEAAIAKMNADIDVVQDHGNNAQTAQNIYAWDAFSGFFHNLQGLFCWYFHFCERNLCC